MNDRNKDRASDQTVLSASIPKLLKKQLKDAAIKEDKTVSKWLTDKLPNVIAGGAEISPLTPKTRQKLAALSIQIGLTQDALLEVAVKGLLDYADAHDGHLTLPLDFTTAWTQLKEVIEEAETLHQSFENPASEGKQAP